jgi:hypothetical protein
MLTSHLGFGRLASAATFRDTGGGSFGFLPLLTLLSGALLIDLRTCRQGRTHCSFSLDGILHTVQCRDLRERFALCARLRQRLAIVLASCATQQ